MSLALALLRSKLISSRAILIPLTKSNVITATIREAHQPGTGYWNKDWRPGPYPHTEEEKRAAAKKYGMLREDYEPYPDDGFGYGDYPKLPIVSSDERDSNEAYTQDHLKRNWGEPLHVDADLYGEDRFNPNERLPMPLWAHYAWFIGWMGGFALLFLIAENYRVQIVKKMPKQMPAAASSELHYTFELE